jgi:hypothetical protein
MKRMCKCWGGAEIMDRKDEENGVSYTVNAACKRREHCHPLINASIIRIDTKLFLYLYDTNTS